MASAEEMKNHYYSVTGKNMQVDR
jgi:hypothetical protein